MIMRIDQQAENSPEPSDFDLTGAERLKVARSIVSIFERSTDPSISSADRKKLYMEVHGSIQAYKDRISRSSLNIAEAEPNTLPTLLWGLQLGIDYMYGFKHFQKAIHKVLHETFGNDHAFMAMASKATILPAFFMSESSRLLKSSFQVRLLGPEIDPADKMKAYIQHCLSHFDDSMPLESIDDRRLIMLSSNIGQYLKAVESKGISPVKLPSNTWPGMVYLVVLTCDTLNQFLSISEPVKEIAAQSSPLASNETTVDQLSCFAKDQFLVSVKNLKAALDK